MSLLQNSYMLIRNNCSQRSITRIYNYILKNKLERYCTSTNLQLNNNTKKEKVVKLPHGPSLEYFLHNKSPQDFTNLSKRELKHVTHPYINPFDLNGKGRSVYLDVYGCPMNVSDAEIVWSILQSHGYVKSDNIKTADVVLVVTCSIRDNSEQKIWSKIKYLNGLKKAKTHKDYPMKIGILGCMAERLKTNLLESEKGIDIVAGPDSYRDLPRLLAICDEEATANVLLSIDETYADVKPVSLSGNDLKSYVSIMRGCDNHCSYCIVPFTRGKERSRNMRTIIDEVKYLSDLGVKEITLLGQNVNSYRDTSENLIDNGISETIYADGFKSIYKPRLGGLKFGELLDQVSSVNPEIRIRFTSPHPKDFPDDVLYLIKERKNICECIHLPAQCGSSRVLKLMNRGYTREAYLKLVEHIRNIIPNVSLTSDLIAGFCGETDEDFQDTLTLMEEVQYDFCYIYGYSMREKTKAHRYLEDDVPEEVKTERVTQMYDLFRKISLIKKRNEIGNLHTVLVEGFSKRSDKYLAGKNDGNTKVIFKDEPINTPDGIRNAKVGDYVVVEITDASSQVLHGNVLYADYLQNISHQ